MKNLIIAVAILALFAGMAVARGPQEATAVPLEGPGRAAVLAWHDDMESGAPGWTHGDDSAQPIRWHVDTYMAFSGSSWWCGTFDYDADGGYGNNWTQYLDTPYVDWSGASYPVLMYYFRNDTEVAYDFSYAMAESAGAFVPLNKGYDGVIPWGSAGYYLGNKDNPAKVRFAFYSDAGYSDADGYYLSVGGAFAVDDVQIVDYYVGTVLFLDDADANVFMLPSVPPAAGDFWSIRSGNCRAFSDPHYWGVTSPDTTFVPPFLQNWLQTPIVDVSSYGTDWPCTAQTAFQMFMPGDYGGSWQEETTNDGGATWTMVGWWYGDQCGYGFGACDHLGFGYSISSDLMGFGTGQVGIKWTMLTDANGNGPTNTPTTPCAYTQAGITIDDTWIYVYEPPPTPVEESSWGKIKSMYR